MSGYNKVYAKTCSTWLLRVFGGMLFSPKVSVSLIHFGLVFTEIQLCLMAGEMNKCLSWSVFPAIECVKVMMIKYLWLMSLSAESIYMTISGST